MRKIILSLALAFTLFSCSSDDSATSTPVNPNPETGDIPVKIKFFVNSDVAIRVHRADGSNGTGFISFENTGIHYDPSDSRVYLVPEVGDQFMWQCTTVTSVGTGTTYTGEFWEYYENGAIEVETFEITDNSYGIYTIEPHE